MLVCLSRNLACVPLLSQDPALIRPGRVDVRVPFPLCSHQQVANYAKHFYGDRLTAEHASAFAEAIPQGTISVAQLQGMLMQHPHDPQAALGVCKREFGGEC